MYKGDADSRRLTLWQAWPSYQRVSFPRAQPTRSRATACYDWKGSQGRPAYDANTPVEDIGHPHRPGIRQGDRDKSGIRRFGHAYVPS